MLETAEMLKMLKMLNVFWTIGPPPQKKVGGGSMVQKTFNIFTFLTFQQFRAFFF